MRNITEKKTGACQREEKWSIKNLKKLERKKYNLTKKKNREPLQRKNVQPEHEEKGK